VSIGGLASRESRRNKEKFRATKTLGEEVEKKKPEGRNERQKAPTGRDGQSTYRDRRPTSHDNGSKVEGGGRDYSRRQCGKCGKE
jgi:hypothetical protein